MHYYQFNIADYRKDTQHLSPLEHYIYRELIDWYYLDEAPIPKITNVVSRRLRLVSENNQTLLDVLQEFFTETENGWVHTRIEHEISAYRARVDTARANGSKGGRPSKPKKTKSVILANPEETETKANHKPITNNHKPIKTIVADAPVFINAEAWAEWVEYRRQAKKKITPATAVKQFSFLAMYDKVIQKTIINRSIERGWAGLFPPEEESHATPRPDGNHGSHQPRPTPAQRTAAKREALRSQSPALGVVATDGGSLWPPVGITAG